MEMGKFNFFSFSVISHHSKGPPTVHQVKIDKVRVSWKDIVKNRECADQFLVKYWPRNQPMQYQGGYSVLS